MGGEIVQVVDYLNRQLGAQVLIPAAIFVIICDLRVGPNAACIGRASKYHPLY